MLINKNNKKFISRSDKPNENWLNDNDYIVVEDNTELYYKILDYSSKGEFNLILDETGELLDVVQDREIEILSELEVLDKTVDRQWEDYYIREKITPVERIAVVITQKEELREELKKLKENDTTDDLEKEENMEEESNAE